MCTQVSVAFAVARAIITMHVLTSDWIGTASQTESGPWSLPIFAWVAEVSEHGGLCSFSTFKTMPCSQISSVMRYCHNTTSETATVELKRRVSRVRPGQLSGWEKNRWLIFQCSFEQVPSVFSGFIGTPRFGSPNLRAWFSRKLVSTSDKPWMYN